MYVDSESEILCSFHDKIKLFLSEIFNLNWQMFEFFLSRESYALELPSDIEFSNTVLCFSLKNFTPPFLNSEINFILTLQRC